MTGPAAPEPRGVDAAGERDMLDAIAATLGQPKWRHIHRTGKYGGKCAITGCDCTDPGCHGVTCGMQAAIDHHDAAVAAEARREAAQDIAAAIEDSTAWHWREGQGLSRAARIAREAAAAPPRPDTQQGDGDG